MPVMKGMRIKTNSPVTKKARLDCCVVLYCALIAALIINLRTYLLKPLSIVFFSSSSSSSTNFIATQVFKQNFRAER